MDITIHQCCRWRDFFVWRPKTHKCWLSCPLQQWLACIFKKKKTISCKSHKLSISFHLIHHSFIQQTCSWSIACSSIYPCRDPYASTFASAQFLCEHECILLPEYMHTHTHPHTPVRKWVQMRTLTPDILHSNQGISLCCDPRRTLVIYPKYNTCNILQVSGN